MTMTQKTWFFVLEPHVTLLMKLKVQQGRVTHEIVVEDATQSIALLHGPIEAKTGINGRQQKLIYKGKVLMAHQTFADMKV